MQSRVGLNNLSLVYTMNHVSVRLLACALLLGIVVPSIASAQKSPPGKLKFEVSRATRQATANAHHAWKRDGGAEFKSGLTYIKGVPVLMLITTKGEPVDKAQRRRRELISACEFLLDENAFERAWICVVEADPRNPGDQTTTNYGFTRADYQAAVKSASRTGTVKDGVKAAREKDAVLGAICTALRVK